jgi:hypothetical protein
LCYGFGKHWIFTKQGIFSFYKVIYDHFDLFQVKTAKRRKKGIGESLITDDANSTDEFIYFSFIT